jgi:SAM-dependent methyltransferase
VKRWFLSYLPPPEDGVSYRIVEEETSGADVVRGVVARGNNAAAAGEGIVVDAGVAILAGRAARESDTAKSFGFEWCSHLRGEIEEGTSFGYSRQEERRRFLSACRMGDEDVAGLSVLDAGCGSARFSFLFAEMGAGHVVGIDINPAVFAAGPAAGPVPNLTLAQGSVLDPGLREASFDLVWCNGVLHHTPDPEGGFRAIAKLVKPGGRLYVWLYGTHWSPLVAVRNVLTALGLRRWTHPTILRVSRLLALLTLGPVWLLKLLSRAVPAVRRNAICRNVVARWGRLGAMTMIWFDVLSPKYRYRYSRATLRRWFAEAGYDVLGEDDYHTGAVGRRKAAASP